MSDKVKSAILAGVALGGVLVVIAVLGALSPALGILGCCSCLIPIGAGIFAVFNYVKKSPTPVQIGDGAMLGAITGLVGGLIYLVIGAPLSFFINAAAIEMQMQQLRGAGVDIPLTGLALVMVSAVLGVVIYTILAAIGGLIGVPLFEKRKGGGANVPPPPPPTGYSGGAGGGASAGYGGGGGGYGGPNT